MARSRDSTRLWITFGGFMLVVLLLDWAEAVLLPIAAALLLTFLLNPPVTFLQRFLNRAAAVLIVVALTFVTLTAVGYVLTRQITTLAAELPNYRSNIREKVLDIRRASSGGPVEQVQTTIEEIKQDIAKADASAASKTRAATPVVLADQPVAGLGLPVWVTSLFPALAAAALVTVLVIFMLLEFGDMRDRFLRLIGTGHLASTTRAFDEATARLSRYLLMQSLINVIYGALLTTGLWGLGVPYPLLWGVLGALLRFIPYVGPWIAAGGPILISFAALPEWETTVWTAGLLVVLELFTNLVLETMWYAGAAGVTQVALIIALAFWTWLWGPMGLLLGTPLTVCLVVMGKHVPGLNFLATLIADEEVLTPDARFYQRLLAREPKDAREIVAEVKATEEGADVHALLFSPALTYLERDRRKGRVSDEEAVEILALIESLSQELGLPPAARGRVELAVRNVTS